MISLSLGLRRNGEVLIVFLADANQSRTWLTTMGGLKIIFTYIKDIIKMGMFST